MKKYTLLIVILLLPLTAAAQLKVVASTSDLAYFAREIGCDLVEVSPPYDTSGNTGLTGANLLYELLCVLPGVKGKPVATAANVQ